MSASSSQSTSSRKKRVVPRDSVAGNSRSRRGAAATPTQPAAPADASPDAAAAASIAVVPLTHESLERSLPHALSKQHAIGWHHCLRHALPTSVASGSSSLLPPLSPAAAHTTHATPASRAGAVTLPLQDRGLGIRSLLFAHTRPLLVATTADCCFVWAHATLTHETESTPASELSWRCIAALPVSSIPAAASTSCSLPCPIHACSAFDAAGSINTSSSSSIIDPALPSLLVTWSADESSLLVAINQPSTRVAASPQIISSSPSPRISGGSVFHSPMPRSSKGSPIPTALTAHLSGSPSILDALFEDAPTPSRALAASPTPTATPGATATQSPSPSTSGSGVKRRKPKRKFTGPQGKEQATWIQLPPRYAVYALHFDAAGTTEAAKSNGVTAPMATSPSPSSAAPTAAAASILADDDDMDTLMTSMLGEINAQLASPQTKPAAAAAASALSSHSTCGHLRLLFSTSAPISAIAANGAGSVVIGDTHGNVSVWEQATTASDDAWGQRLHVSPSMSGVSASSSRIVALTRMDEQRWLVAYEDADVLVCDLATGSVLHKLAACLRAHPPQPLDSSPSLAPTMDVVYNGSPTTSTPPHSPHRTGSSSHIPETPVSGVDGASQLQSREEEEQKLMGRATVNAAVPLLSHSHSGTSAQLAMLVSPPICSPSDDATLASPTPSQQPARKSARKLAAAAPQLPPPPCPASLPAMIALQMRWPTEDEERSASPELEAHKFTVPLLLSDDNASVHATAVATSPASANESAPLSSSSSLVAFGLSTGALLLYSATSRRLVAMLSDGSSGADESAAAAAAMTDEDGQQEAQPEPLMCQRAEMRDHVTFASPSNEPHAADAGSIRSGASQLMSPASSQRASRTAAKSPRRGGRAPIALSPPPSSQAHRASSQGTLPAADRKHICTQAVTALAFHPRYQALIAVGNQAGHVHIYAPSELKGM